MTLKKINLLNETKIRQPSYNLESNFHEYIDQNYQMKSKLIIYKKYICRIHTILVQINLNIQIML